MKLGQSAIPEDLRRIAEEMLGKHCPSSVVKLLINVVSGESLTSKKTRGAVMLRKFSDGTKNSEDTTAQQLLNYVKNKPGMVYAYMTASFDAAMGLVRVSKGMIYSHSFFLCAHKRSHCSSHTNGSGWEEI
jgi:hypothetical protein